jgi:hypothetical protein
MAVYAPITDPNKLIPGNETVYVTNYWDFDDLNFFTDTYGPFFPKNLTTFPTGKEFFQFPVIKMIPGSFVGVMTKKEYDELLQFTKQQIAQFFIQRSNFTPFGRILVPSIGVIGLENLNIDNVIKSLFGPYSIFLPRIVPFRVTDRLNDLFITYCQFSTIEGLFVSQSSEVVTCDKCLPYEAEFMKSFTGLAETIKIFENLFVHSYITNSFGNIKINNVRSKVPACNLCIYYVVYCGSPYDDIDLFQQKPILKTKGLILEKFTVDDENDYEDTPNIKFFRTLKEAKKYFNETLNNTKSKWLCLPKVPGVIGPDRELECKEMLEPCAIEYVDGDEDIVLYDSKEECEENCNKKWYCINGKCVKKSVDDPEVAELTPFENEEECNDNCDTDSDSDNDSSTGFCCICVGPSYGYTVDLSNSGGDIGADKPFGGLTPAGGWGGTITYEDGQGQLVFVSKDVGMPPPEIADNLTPVSASYNTGYKPCRYVEQLQNGVTIQGKTYIINGDDDSAYPYSSAWTLDDGNKKYSVCRNDCDKACCEQCREIDQSSIEKFGETANDPCGFFTSAVNKVCCEDPQLYDENNLGSCLCEE